MPKTAEVIVTDTPEQAAERERFERNVITLTQDVGETGATRVHELGGDTLTIFKDAELFEFARRCAALSAAQPVRDEATERDAARYRHLRNGEWECFTDRWLVDINVYGQDPEDLDAAIDAAMSQEW